MAEQEKPLGVFSIIIIVFLTFVVFGVIVGTMLGPTCDGRDHLISRFDEICASR